MNSCKNEFEKGVENHECTYCSGFVGAVAEAAIEAYVRIDSERAALRKLERAKGLGSFEVEELSLVDSSALGEVHRLATESFGESVSYAVRIRFRVGYDEGVGVFVRLREGVTPPVSMGTVYDLVPGVDTQFSNGEFRLRVFGRSCCPIRYFALEGGGYLELGRGDLGGLASLALLGVCTGRLAPFYAALLGWVERLMPFEAGDVELEGYEDVVERCEAILRIDDPGVMRRHILLAGPPGTGKSMILKKVAGAHPEFVRFNLTRGENWLEVVRLLGRVVEGCGRRVLVVADEVDELGLSRADGGEAVYELLRLLDGVGASRSIVVLASTSRVECLDPALLRPGRFGPVIGVGMPDSEQVARIAGYFAARHGGVVDGEAVARSCRCSGAEIRAAVEDCVLDGVPVTTGAVLSNLRELRGGRL